MFLSRWSFCPLLLLFCVIYVAPARAARVLTPEIYSEYVTLDENNGSSFDTNARLLWRKEQENKIEPYVGFSFLRYSAYGSSIERKSPLLGLRWQPFSFLRVFGEYRLAYDNSQISKHDDPRLGLILARWQELAPLPAKLRLVSDNYGEFIYMNRYSTAPMAAGWSKLLVRGNPLPSFYVDGFTEAYILESRDPALGRKSQELRYGARAGWVGNRIGLTAILFRRFATLVPAPQARVRFLFAVGGNF